MTMVELTQSGDDLPVESVQPHHSVAEVDEHILRLQRIGKSLFRVANCFILFDDATLQQQSELALSHMSPEWLFCSEMPAVDKFSAVPDTHQDVAISAHRFVVGNPHIRFYAAYPIRNDAHAIIGRICLVDDKPRVVAKDEEDVLVDIAHLVERELHIRLISISHLVLQKRNKNLRRKSLIDPLIGTWNRGAIMRILSIEANRCDKLGVPLSLVVVDIDYFKKINDTYGHPAGDAVLVKIASRMRSCIRPLEALGRYGGEEFLVVLPGSSLEVAVAVAERMREAVAAHAEIIGADTVKLTISAGVSSTQIFPHATVEELISRADIALYRAKDAGRNIVKKALPE